MITHPHTDSVVVRFVSMRSLPFIMLFALYVLGHGEDGPGGGFQGGVIFAAAYVLHGLVNGWEAGRGRFPEPASDALAPAGALLYGAIGLGALVLGGAFLEYEAYVGSGDEHLRHAAHHFGLIGIETGVAITVSASMITLFFEMARPHAVLDPRTERARARRRRRGRI